jgi:fused signal recognition particle receptor
LSENHDSPKGPDAQSADASKETAAKPGFFKRLLGRKAEAPKLVPDGGAVAAEPVVVAEPVAEPPDARPEAGESSIQELSIEERSVEGAPAEQAPFEADLSEEVPSEDVPFGEVPAEEALIEEAPAKASWWTRLRKGLSRSSSAIGTGISEIFSKRKLDAGMLEELEDVLIRADLGVSAAARIAAAVGTGRYDKNIAADEVKQILATEVERVLAPYGKPLEIDRAHKPFVVLVVGVNGSGKTTTIGKLAARFTREGHKVMLAAGDTFRAAAIEQLRIWGERLGCVVVSREQGGDAAGLGYDAIKTAQESGADVLLMDTAGRLQNRTELMAELEKIIRVMKKLDASAPHAVLLVLDATVGQNAMNQVEIFGRVAGVTGLVMTKLDGTARGGILVAIAEKFQLPIHYIGVGETADDLASFEAKDFGRAIAGLDA